MGNVREVFDIKQHPGKYGEPIPLELMVQAMEERFRKLYEKDFIDTYGWMLGNLRHLKARDFLSMESMNGTQYSSNMMMERMATEFG